MASEALLPGHTPMGAFSSRDHVLLGCRDRWRFGTHGHDHRVGAHHREPGAPKTAAWPILPEHGMKRGRKGLWRSVHRHGRNRRVREVWPENGTDSPQSDACVAFPTLRAGHRNDTYHGVQQTTAERIHRVAVCAREEREHGKQDNEGFHQVEEEKPIRGNNRYMTGVPMEAVPIPLPAQGRRSQPGRSPQHTRLCSSELETGADPAPLGDSIPIE